MAWESQSVVLRGLSRLVAAADVAKGEYCGEEAVETAVFREGLEVLVQVLAVLRFFGV